jgi:SAM-dependent methyltransferase
MESEYVHEVYEKIAQHFSDTRYRPWRKVREFLDAQDTLSLIGDIGCGNGKNMCYRDDLMYIGCDITENLLEIAEKKTNSICRVSGTFRASGTNLPIRKNLLDGVISIAVLHHLSEVKDRTQFVRELIRCTRSKGKILFTVWALEQPKKEKWIDRGNGDFFIPWTDKTGETYNRFYHFFSEQEIIDFSKEFTDECNIVDISTECYNHYVTLEKI